MDDALYVGDVTVSSVAASAAPMAATSATAATDVDAATVHTLALGIDDADDLLRRHAIGDAAVGAVPPVVSTVIEATHELPATLPTVPGAHPPASMSAVYRFYEIEATLSLKRREESSIAKCRLCKDEGRLERKGCVRFSKSVTSNLWRHLKENHPVVYEKHVGEKKTIQMHKLVGAGKRGRKKKATAVSTVASATAVPLAPAATAMPSHGGDNEQFLEDVGDDSGPSGHSDGAMVVRKPVTKRARRQAPSPTVGDQFFTDYALSMSAAAQHGQHALTAIHGSVTGTGSSNGSAVAVVDKRSIHLDRVREAAAYLCVHELVPLELCASLAFRNVLAECHVSSALVDDATALATAFGKQAITLQTKKLLDDVHDRVATQLKTVDGVHLQLTEWASAPQDDVTTQTQIVGVFAVSLDTEFNVVRRCLCAVPVDGAGSDLGSQLAQSSAFQRALTLLAPHQHVPNLVVVEPSRRSHFASVLAHTKLDVLESITSLLRDIMVSTFTGAAFPHPFMVSSDMTSSDDSELTPEGFQRGFDTTRFLEPASHSDAPLTELLNAETATSILTELPNVLTGHTIRDILLKVLHLVAHLKQCTATRQVMRRIVVGEFRMTADVFTQMFERGLTALPVSVHAIHDVLTLTLKMMPTLQRYFELHKDGTSDLSKLMQLASLSAYEWERVGHLASLLKPFADAVAKLHEEQYVTSSLIIPSVYTLLEKLRAPADGGATSDLPEDMAALKHVAYAHLSSTFAYLFVEPNDDWSPHQRSTFNWLWSATLLDPRTRPFIIKGALPQAQFWEVVKAEASEIAGMNKVKDKDHGLSDLPEHPIALDDHDANGVDGAVGAGPHANGHDEPTGDLWDDLQANLTSCAQEEMLLASSKSALELTKSNNLLEVEISFLQDESRISLKANPLDWWQSMRVKYPYVARLARYVLSVPGSPPLDENPVLHDAGLVRRLLSSMSANDASELITASMNLRLEKKAQVESAPRQLWSTV